LLRNTFSTALRAQGAPLLLTALASACVRILVT
jgi:hypothetical protein